MRPSTEASREAVYRSVDAVADAAQMSRDELRDSGVLIRLLRGMKSVDGATVIVTGVEVVYRYLLPLLDEEMLATALGLSVTHSDENVLRLER